MTGFRLEQVAPRLARARDQWVAFEAERRRRERKRLREELELDRLIAHRELQLARAYSTRNAKYIAARERKLAAARRRRARLDEAA